MKKLIVLAICMLFVNIKCQKSATAIDSIKTPFETRIDDLIQLIEDGTYPDIHSLLIVRNDSMIVEEYFNGYHSETIHTLQSVSKSVTSALIGIALNKDIIESIEEPILDYFPQYTNIENMNDWKRSIKIKDLLTMRTGTDYDEGYTGSPHNQLNSRRRGWDIFYLNRPMEAAPGTRFQYDSGGVILISAILKNAFEMHADVFAEKYLFPNLDIEDFRWIKNSEGHPHTGGGLYLKPRDMVKFGLMYLNGGEWNRKQVVPEDWVNESFEMHVEFGPGGTYDRGYGYLWWIMKPAPKSKTNEYVYAAKGFMGQYIFVIPEYEMVVVVTAGARNGYDMNNPVRFLYSHILADVE